MLRRDAFNQAFGSDGFDDGEVVVDGLVEQFQQRGFVQISTCGKFFVTDANIFFSAEACADPLLHVAAQMQNSISHRILIFAAALPDLFFAEFGKAAVNDVCHLL